jgi:hypothetical protein
LFTFRQVSNGMLYSILEGAFFLLSFFLCIVESSV